MSYSFNKLDRLNTDSIKWKLAKEQSGKDDVLTFSIADSDYETAPEIKRALEARLRHGAFGYTDSSDYATVVQEWYQKRYSVEIDKARIISAPTVLNAISVVIRLCTKVNEGVLVQTPVYHVFKPIIEDNSRLVIENKLYVYDLVYRMDFTDLEEWFLSGIKTIIICSPHNPVGRVWNRRELSQLVELCKKYQVLIIADEIHSDIIMKGKKFISLASFFNVYNNIIIISAPTKTFNLAGLQIANIISGNNDLHEKIKKEYIRLHLATPNLMALTALITAYQEGETWLEEQNNHIYNNYCFISDFFKENAYIEVFPLEGTYLAWLKLKMNSTRFVEEMAKEGIILSDGKKFGESEDFVRFNLACSKEQLIKGLEKIKKYLDMSRENKNEE